MVASSDRPRPQFVEPGQPNVNARWDLVPGKGVFSTAINVQDVSILVTLYPPMLNGARALNGPVCPYPSQ